MLNLGKNNLAELIFLQAYNLFEFSFPSPRLVATSWLKSLVSSTIYP